MFETYMQVQHCTCYTSSSCKNSSRIRWDFLVQKSTPEGSIIGFGHYKRKAFMSATTKKSDNIWVRWELPRINKNKSCKTYFKSLISFSNFDMDFFELSDFRINTGASLQVPE